MSHYEWPAHQRLCYYPSSGHRLLWVVMQLDCDSFVFSDSDRERNNWSLIEQDFQSSLQPIEKLSETDSYVEFRVGKKTAVYFFEDNNEVLERLDNEDLKVHHFVGICDGCMEGGNYECVHDRPFVWRLLRLAADGMRYTTDHSEGLQVSRNTAFYNRAPSRKFLQSVAARDFTPGKVFYRRTNWPEPRSAELADAVFELQGVLVKDDAGRYYELSKGWDGCTQLQTLRLFRSHGRRGILAEYVVRFHGG